MTDTGATGATGAANAPADPLAATQSAYMAALDAAAAPDPEAVKLRTMARDLLKQADAIDGPKRIAARQTKQQFTQFHQREGARSAHRPAATPAPTKGATGTQPKT